MSPAGHPPSPAPSKTVPGQLKQQNRHPQPLQTALSSQRWNIYPPKTCPTIRTGLQSLGGETPQTWRRMRIGRRFPRDFTPALCLALCHPTGLGLTEKGRGNNAKRPCRAVRRSRSLPVGGARPTQGLGARETPAPKRRPPTSMAKPQTLGESRSPAAGAASSPRRGCATRVNAAFTPPGPEGQSPAPARTRGAGRPGPQNPAGTRRCPPPQPALAPRPRRCNIWTTKAALGLNGPD